MSAPKTIEFFFDIGSAYSYLASTQIERVAARHNANVVWRPMLLGGVFKATGNEMPARIPAKAMWMLDDLQRWGRRYDIPVRTPSRFPLNTLRTERALAASGRVHGAASVGPFAHALFRAYWVDDRDISIDDEIRTAAKSAGLDPDPIIAGIDAQETKDVLRATTDEAVARGAFGAPTMYVGKAMFWGNDRLDLLEDELRSLA